jgi:hypothetical protein
MSNQSQARPIKPPATLSPRLREALKESRARTVACILEQAGMSLNSAAPASGKSAGTPKPKS